METHSAECMLPIPAGFVAPLLAMPHAVMTSATKLSLAGFSRTSCGLTMGKKNPMTDPTSGVADATPSGFGRRLGVRDCPLQECAVMTRYALASGRQVPSTSDAGSGQRGNGGIFEEPDRVRVRYIPQTRWNNVRLSVPGLGFTAIDATVNAI